MTVLADLKTLVLRHCPRPGRLTPMPGLSLVRSDTTTGRIGAVYSPSLCIVLQGSKTTMLGSRIFRYEAGNYLVTSVDVPVTGQITGASAASPYLALALTLDTATLSGLLLEAREAPPAPCAALAVSTVDEDLLEPVLRVLRLLDRPRDIPVLFPLLTREILYRLLSGEQSAVLRQIGLAGSPMSRIGRCIGWLRAHYDRPLRVEMLAGLAHMSVSSFHRHFKAVTAMTPLQYQKQLRLQEARRLLLAQGGEVASVGFAVGYESPSQFSREYRRMFGEAPGRDGQNLRAAVSSGRIMPLSVMEQG